MPGTGKVRETGKGWRAKRLPSPLIAFVFPRLSNIYFRASLPHLNAWKKNRLQISTLSNKLIVYPSLRFDGLNIDLMYRRILSNNDIKDVEDGAFDGLENLSEM